MIIGPLLKFHGTRDILWFTDPHSNNIWLTQFVSGPTWRV